MGLSSSFAIFIMPVARTSSAPWLSSVRVNNRRKDLPIGTQLEEDANRNADRLRRLT